MSIETDELLHHMLEAVTVGRQIAAAGKDRFDDDPVTRFATDTVISRLAECANKLPEDVLAQMHEVPWRAVSGMRNRLQHASIETDYDLVWRVLDENLPDIEAALRRALG